jgi:hypothetical protein
MKNGNRVSLIAAASALFLSSVSGNASAGNWIGTPLKGHAAVSSKTIVYALGNTWGPSGGWRVRSYDFANPSVSDENAWGTSIAVDLSGGVWVARPDGVIQNVRFGTTIGGSGCGGEFVLVRQEQGHNNLAMTSSTQPSIIDIYGRVHMWSSSGNCWSRLPDFPSGIVANDIAISGLGALRAADANGHAWAYSFGTWSELSGGGQVKALGFTGSNNVTTYGVGFDNWSVWKWTSGSGWTQPWSSPTDWHDWQIFQLGSSAYNTLPSKTVTGVLTALDGGVWAFGDAL